MAVKERRKKSEPAVEVKRVAKRLNGGRLKGVIREGSAFRVNGDKQVVACRETLVDFCLGRLPAHASGQLKQLVMKGLSGLGTVEEVKVPAGGKYRAGWRADGIIVYHHPLSS